MIEIRLDTTALKPKLLADEMVERASAVVTTGPRTLRDGTSRSEQAAGVRPGFTT